MTIHIQPANHWSEVASLLAQINASETSHIGYCGTDQAEIEATLREDFELNEVLFAYEKNEIVGVLAFDYDVDDKQADVWGPFLQENQSIEVAQRLWEAHPLTNNEWSYHFFINTKNQTTTHFVTSILGAKKQGIHLALTKQNHNHKQSAPSPIEIDLKNEADKEAFIRIHQSAFPRAYYSGEEILSRLITINGCFYLNMREMFVVMFTLKQTQSLVKEVSNLSQLIPPCRKEALAACC